MSTATTNDTDLGSTYWLGVEPCRTLEHLWQLYFAIQS
jgi:hypothetical protein